MTEPDGAQVPERIKPWRWPGEWFRQESFWRDVASRTLAAVFAAGFVYVFAVAGGYVASPDGWPFLALAGWFVLGILWYRVSSKLNPNGWYGRVPTWILKIVEYAFSAGTALIVYWVLFNR